MSDDPLTPDEQRVLDRLFRRARPVELEGDWERTLRQSIARSRLDRPDGGESDPSEADDDADVVTLHPPDSARRWPSTELVLRAAVVLVLVGAAVTMWRAAVGDGDGTPIEGVENVEDGTIAIGGARLTVRSERDPVAVNGSPLATGTVQDATPGDVVSVETDGVAVITAESVVEIEALRGASLTVPELSTPITVDLEFGHLFVELNPAAQATVTVDVGERQFTTRSADASFAVCQAPDGASCLAVLRGEVEWFEDGVGSEVYRTGQSSFAARGAAPDPPRCADELAVGEMRQALGGEEFTGALADIVATWDQCDPSDLSVSTVELPSAARMAHVVAPEIVIGSPDIAENTDNNIARRTVDGSADYYIEPLAVTNAEFRTWLVTSAGDDTDLWSQRAPQDWIDRAPGGAATQAIYAEGTADEAVQGITFSTASDFCSAQAKRLPTEIEWELAAANGVLEDLADEAQDWVTDWEEYGPGPDDAGDRQVLRGTDGLLAADQYFRTFAVTDAEATAARQFARIRCAADEVAIGGQAFSTIAFEDDFTSLDWPTVTEDFFELDYHPENYHLDLTTQHGQAAVLRQLEQPVDIGRIDVDLFIERNNTGSDTGNHRFGLVVGNADELFTLTVQPDQFTANSFVACLLPMGPELSAELALDENAPSPSDPYRFGGVELAEGHYGEDCIEAARLAEVRVATIDSPLRLSLVLGETGLEAWVNDTLVDASASISAIDTVGFYSQLYHRPRAHIHLDDLIVATN